MAMEIVQHLGFFFEPHPTVESSLYKLRGLVTLWLLLNLVCWYHYVSFCMSLMAIFLPDLAAYTKRLTANFLWRVCIFLSELNRVTIECIGDEIDPFSAVLLANHQLLADYVVVAALAHKPRKDASGKKLIQREATPQVNFFTWFTLSRAPSVKTLINMLRCNENWELQLQQSDRLFRRVCASSAPEWVVLFPEVNIWTEETAYLQSIHSRRYFLPRMTLVLYPRFSSLYNTVWLLRKERAFTKIPKFTTLYDLLIVHSKPVTLLEFFSCKGGHKVVVNVKQRSFQKVPLRRPKLEKWLENCWVEKNKQIRGMKNTLKT